MINDPWRSILIAFGQGGGGGGAGGYGGGGVDVKLRQYN